MPDPAPPDWYARHGCTHAHCPNGCDKPQPVEVGGELYCLRCNVETGAAMKMVPCTPETCDDA